MTAAQALNQLWVARTGAKGVVTRYDTRTGRVGPSVEVGWYPIAIAVTATDIWVANSSGDGSRPSAKQDVVSRVRSTTRRTVAEIAIQGLTDIVAGDTGVWVATAETEVIPIDPVANTAGAAISLGGSGATRLTMVGSTLWATCARPTGRGSIVTRIDTVTRTITGQLTIPGGAAGLVVRGRDLWLAQPLVEGPDNGRLVRIDEARMRLLPGAVAVPWPNGVAADGDGGLWLSSPNGSVTAVSEARESIVATGSVGLTADGIVAGAAGIWVITYDGPVKVEVTE